MEEEKGCILNVECQEGHAGGRDIVVVIQFVQWATGVSYRGYKSATSSLIG